MKSIETRSSGWAGALILLATMGVALQASQSMAASAASAASSASAPAATRKENRALRKSVYAAFAKDKGIDAGDIGVSAKNGAVTLTGTAADAAQIDTIADIAKGVPGVTSVTNK